MRSGIKIIKTDPEWLSHHIRDVNIDIEPLDDRSDGLIRFTTICGIKVLGKQFVTERVKKEELCENCKRVAESRGLELDSIYQDSSRLS